MRFANHEDRDRGMYLEVWFYHPSYGCISFINIYSDNFKKNGVPFCLHFTRLTFIVCNMWRVDETNI